MLPSTRKDLEERIESVQSGQFQLEEKLDALPAQLSGPMQAETDHIVKRIGAAFEAQQKGAVQQLSEVKSGILQANQLNKTEILQSLADMALLQQKQIADLQTEFARQLEDLNARVESFETQWRQNVSAPIDDISDEAVRVWSELIGARLKAFGAATGMPRAFALQLFQELKELKTLDAQLSEEKPNFADKLDDLQRVLFVAERALPWTCLTPHNSTDSQRRELRILETAVAQLRSYEQERLLQIAGIRPLEVVPNGTQFDASVHESNEFLEVPTPDESKHNLILSVEKPGFQQISDFGAPQLLRPVRVRRYVFHRSDNEAPVAAEVEANAAEEVAIDEVVDDAMPRVSGQL